VIQHEYDHIQGILFIDQISPLKRKIIEKKLSKISKGNINSNYKMLFNK
jgi:peptide deformylase